MLQGWVLNNLIRMFSDVNDKVGTMRGSQQDANTWNSGIFSIDTDAFGKRVVPIAGMIFFV